MCDLQSVTPLVKGALTFAIAHTLHRGCNLVCLRRHNKIIAVQVMDGVGPPGDGHLPPLGQNCWVMAFCLGHFPNLLSKGQSGHKVFERINSPQARLTAMLDH